MRNTHAHFFPVVIQLFAAIETANISALTHSISQLRAAGRRNREGCPLMRTTKDTFEQRSDHLLAPGRVDAFDVSHLVDACAGPKAQNVRDVDYTGYWN